MKIFRHFWVYSTLFFVLSGMLDSNAQIAERTGLIFDDAAFEALEGAQLASPKFGLPTKVSLQKYAPFPQSQGRISSCVGWAVGYGALTIQRAQAMGISDRTYITKHLAHSASFIYNQIKRNDDCQSGASLSDALELLVYQGDCLINTFPTSKTACSELPPIAAKTEAQHYKIRPIAFKLFDTQASEREKLRSTRQHLAKGIPVVVGFSVTPSYAPFRGKSVWQAEGIQSGHAMVVIGYDDAKSSVQLMNSYGPSWGEGGFIWMSYSDFVRYARQGISLEQLDGSKGSIAQETAIASVTVPMSAKLQLKYLNGERTFVAAQPHFDVNKKGYIFEETWQADDDLFRLQVAVPQGRCAYLFSVDAAGRTDSIWSMPYYHRDTSLTLPTRGYYQFSSKGSEQLCLLLSYEPITDFRTLLSQFEYNCASDLSEKIQCVFGAQLVPFDPTIYAPKEIAFETQVTFDAGIALPLLLELRLE